MKSQKLINESPHQIGDNNFLTSNKSSLTAYFFELSNGDYFQLYTKS